MKKLLVFLLIGISACAFAAEITLAEDGMANASIVIPEKAKPIVRFAASELAEHLHRMTGGEFPIATEPGPRVNIFLGFGNAEDFKPDEYVIDAHGCRIDIFGKDTDKKVKLFNYFYDNPDKGTLRGVYNFLDSLGVRWLAPGKDGAYIPKCKTLRIPEQKIRYKPLCQDRQITDAWNFMKFPDAKEYATGVGDLYLWGIRNNVSTRNMVPGCHSERSLKLFENPEWLAHPTAHQRMKDGKRNPRHSCWTDPYTKEVWLRAVDGYFSGKSPKECGFALKGYLHSKWPNPFISPDEFMIDPMDHDSNNDGRCWCERCQEFRRNHPCADDTEIIWQVIGEVAKYVNEKYPGRYVSTLIYPPKKLIPTMIEKPKNIRVRICFTGARSMVFPEKLAEDLKILKEWGDFLGPKNIPLWVYQCSASFGRFLPGIPDSYPRLTARYIQTMQPYCAGMYCENHNLTHTYRNLDVYIYMRLLWNSDRDVDKELEEYFNLYYGPAAAPAKELFALFEEKWIEIDREVLFKENQQIGLIGKNKDRSQKKVWGDIYTVDEMTRIDALMQSIQELSPAGSIYAKRAELLRKYLVQIMKSERSNVMDKEERRQALKVSAPFSESKEFPLESEWANAPEYVLISAQKMKPELQAAGSFRLLSSDDTVFIKAVLKDPQMSDSKTDGSHKSGSPDIWRDNCIELFFYAEKSKKFWQILINDNNAWSSQTKGRVLSRWEQINGMRVKTRRTADGWTAEIAIPLAALKTDKTDLRFNFTRERNVKGRPTEYSTWSPLATMGNWHGVDNYGTVVLPPR